MTKKNETVMPSMSDQPNMDRFADLIKKIAELPPDGQLQVATQVNMLNALYAAGYRKVDTLGEHLTA